MPATNAISNRFYPQLSDVISVDDLPDFLDFAKDGLDSVLSSIHYKNLQYSKSARGDSAFYSLDVISKNIGLDLPFGLRFVLNPDVNGDTSISSFPVTLQYKWELLAFLNSFKLQNFSFTPDAFYQLGLKIFRVSDDQVFANVLTHFVNPSSSDISNLEQLITDINTFYPAANLTIPSGSTPTIASVISLIKQNVNIPASISEMMFAIYLLSTDSNTTRQRLQQFYQTIVPDGLENYIQKLIKPSAKASLQLSAGIEFPTSMHMVLLYLTKNRFSNLRKQPLPSIPTQV
jgi:hypothetical protein